MMNTPLVSIIVPVYQTNIELLKRCVNSISAQTYKKLEVIIVLNGNTPDYDNEVRKAVGRERVKIHETDKIGPSAARNEGLRFAKGEFIAFADADDEVVPTYIENALRIIKTTGANVAVGGLRYRFDGYDRLLCYSGDIVVLEGTDICQHLLTASDGPKDGINGYLFNSACGKLFRRDVLEQTRYNEDVSFYEDMLFMFSVAVKGASFALSSEIWYTYYQYSRSLLHSKNENTIHNFQIILSIINDRIIGNNIEDIMRVPFCSFFFWCIQFSVQTADSFLCFVSFINNCEQLSLTTGLLDVWKGRTYRFTKFCIRHQFYRLYYTAKKVRQFIARIKNGAKKDKLIRKE